MECTVSLAACAAGRCPEGSAYYAREWYQSGQHVVALVLDMGAAGQLRAYRDRHHGWRVSNGSGHRDVWGRVHELRAAGVVAAVFAPDCYGHTDYYVSPAVLERLGVAQ
jgi:hypothetical protein